MKLRYDDIAIESIDSEALIQQTLTENIGSGFLLYHKKKDGSVFPVEISASTFKLAGRKVICVLVRDITQRIEAEQELTRSREQLRNLSAYLQSAREQERTSIAREVHDDLGQALTALNMDVSWLNKKLPKREDSLIRKTESMMTLIDMTIQSVKRISSELRPGLLDDLGLTAAVEWQASQFKEHTGISCDLTLESEDMDVDQGSATAIFRIFQETLTNVARHAGATQVDVSLKKDNSNLLLTVKDNGKGITRSQLSNSRSFGLIGMRERALTLGGDVSITGKRNKGTTLVLRVPVER
jgi:signal transduction histidine kinase